MKLDAFEQAMYRSDPDLPVPIWHVVRAILAGLCLWAVVLWVGWTVWGWL